MYIRNCPKCNKELTYKHKSNLNRAIRNSVICRNKIKYINENIKPIKILLVDVKQNYRILN